MDRAHIKSFMAMSLPQMGTMIFQAVTGQATTLLIANLGEIAIAASTATSTASMIFANGISTTVMFVSSIRVGFFLGKGQPALARAVSNLSIGLGFAVNGVLGMLLIVFARPLMHGVTSDSSVQTAAISIMPAQVVNMIASCVVGTVTSGILTSQGRTKVVTCLSFGFELPFSIGSVALLVLVFKADLLTVFWAQAAVSTFEMVVVLAIVQRSDWARYAREAQERQGAAAPEDTGPEEAPHNASVMSLQPQNTEDNVATT
jgi:MATE family multidrug resistance protein